MEHIVPTGRQTSSVKPGGVQNWILAVLKEEARSGCLSTAKIAKRLAKASGKRYHPNSIYTALRILTTRGAIQSSRKGRKKAYALVSPSRQVISQPRYREERGLRDEPPKASLPRSRPASPEEIRLAAGLPETLAPGEILLFPERDGNILAATNLHGKLVFERHHRVK